MKIFFKTKSKYAIENLLKINIKQSIDLDISKTKNKQKKPLPNGDR